MRVVSLTAIAIVFGLFISDQTLAQQRGVNLSSTTQATKRTALVIGNAAYSVGPLNNPVNDAKDMARTLGELGFEVLYRENVSQKEMKRAVLELANKLKGGGVGLFYYAGHGFQVNGQNYLIPVDAVINGEEDVKSEAVEAGFVLEQMEAARSEVDIIILDACRDNPFARNWRSLSRGLVSMDTPKTKNTLIAFATAPGSTADDGDPKKGQRNGLYTQELLKYMRTPNLKLEDVFKNVRISVYNLTRGKQVPWEHTSLRDTFYFNPAEVIAPQNGASLAVAVSEPLTENHKYYERRGLQFQQEGKYAEAEAEYRKGLRLKPADKRLRIFLGVVLGEQKKYRESLDEYLKILAEDPENWNAAINYAMLYSNHGAGNPDEALKQAKMLIKHYPDAPLYADVLGWVYYRMGRYDEAIEHLQKAVNKAFSVTSFHFHLGMALARKGDKKRAQIELEEALRKNDLLAEDAEEARYTLKLLSAVGGGTTSGSVQPDPNKTASSEETGEQRFQRLLKGVVWLEHGTRIGELEVFLEFEAGGFVRTRTPKDMVGYVAGNQMWYLSGDTLHVLTFEDSSKKNITARAEGVIKGNRIEGTFTMKTSGPWLLTKVIR